MRRSGSESIAADPRPPISVVHRFGVLHRLLRPRWRGQSAGSLHGSRKQRERDIRRDALLATIGWQTMRFSFARLTRQAEACQREIRATHAARLQLFGGISER